MPNIVGQIGSIVGETTSGGGGGTWGSITGTLSAQTDLATALDGKADITGDTFTGAVAVQSNSATAFAVGPNGATNPSLLIDSSAASAATGVKIVAAGAGGGATITASSSVADETLIIASLGSSELQLNAGTIGSNSLRLRSGGTNRIILNSSSFTFANTAQYVFTPTSSSTAATIRYSYTSIAETNLTAGVESPNVVWNLANSRSHASNTAITLQRDFRIAGTSHAFATAGGTMTDLGALAIVHGTGGANATITNNSALLVQSNTVSNTTNGYGINVSAPTGATNNYAARLIGALDFGAGAGTAGQVLTSGGAGASPTWSSAGGGATALTTVEKNLGTSPRRAGKFTITGLSGLTVNKPVSISQAVGPYTNKGTLADEAEMDGLIIKAIVTAADTITAYWNSATAVRGNFKFNYFVGA